MNYTQKAILKTLIYADMFNYPLTVYQIHRFLISNKPQPLSVIKQNLKHSLQQQIISTHQNFFTLPARVEIISTIAKRQKYSQQKKNRAKQIAQQLSSISSLQALFLTGALAMDNTGSDDDIDVMLVTSPNQLWTTRLKVIRSLDQLGVRRKARMTLAKDLICPNIYVTTQSLGIPPKSQNLYTAHEIAQVIPLFDKSSVYSQFLNQNQWIKKFLANFPIPNISSDYDINHQIHPNTPKYTEKFFYIMQKLYMQHHRTTESVSMNRAFFHPRPTSSIILDEYRNRTKALDIGFK